MGHEEARAIAEALELDKRLGHSRARVLRAAQALTFEHNEQPDWPGASARQIALAAGFTYQWVKRQCDWLTDQGLLHRSTTKATTVYRARV